MDMRVAYIIDNNTICQAEDQEINTAAYQGSTCGGPFSEMRYCNGQIRFLTGATPPPTADGDVNNDGGCPALQGYNPMHKEGAVILGIGGDNCNGSAGTFYEGAITTGYATDAIDDAIQTNIIAAGYGSATTPGPTRTPAPEPAPNQNLIWSGGPYSLNGGSDYVSLPDGITNDLYDFSIACWVKLNSLDTWSRIFVFGGDTSVFMMFTPESGNAGYPYFCLTTSGNDGEQGFECCGSDCAWKQSAGCSIG